MGYFKVACQNFPGRNEGTKERNSENLVPGPKFEPETFRMLTPGLQCMVHPLLISADEEVNGI